MSYDAWKTGGCNPGWLAEWDIPCPSPECDCAGCEGERARLDALAEADERDYLQEQALRQALAKVTKEA